MKMPTLALLACASVLILAESTAATKNKSAVEANECAASVTLISVTKDTNTSTWYFLFDIVESGKSDTGTSSGAFAYDYIYYDENQMPVSVTGIQGPDWRPANGHEYRPTAGQDLPHAVSIALANVIIHDLFSHDCYDTAQKKTRK